MRKRREKESGEKGMREEDGGLPEPSAELAQANCRSCLG